MTIKFLNFRNLAIGALCLTVAFVASCKKESVSNTPADPVAANIAKYSSVWDGIINGRKLDLFNETNFDKNVVFHMSPNDVVGIDSARAYYANYLTGFSNIEFRIVDIFGQGDKLTKHWTFKGVHTGDFFGIPATNKQVLVQGSTIARMENGKIMEEQDFFDNLDLLTQLGLYP